MMNIWLGLTHLHSNSSNCHIQGASPAVISNPDDYCTFQSLDDLFKLNFYYSFSSLSLVVLMLVIDKIPRKYVLCKSKIKFKVISLPLLEDASLILAKAYTGSAH